jgi:hypothetical protein
VPSNSVAQGGLSWPSYPTRLLWGEKPEPNSPTAEERLDNVAAHLTLFVFSKWMNSRRSLDSGRIWVLGHDQVEQQLQFFISGQGPVIGIVGIISFFKGTEFMNYLFHSNITVIR